MPRIILDTGALWSPGVIRQAAKSQDVELVLPAVAFTERARQIERDGQQLRDLRRLINELGIKIEDFTPDHGLRVAAHVVDDKKWEKLSRDAMIAGHIGREDIILTSNEEDFLDLNIPKKQVIGVPGRGSKARRGR